MSIQTRRAITAAARAKLEEKGEALEWCVWKGLQNRVQRSVKGGAIATAPLSS